MSKRDAMWYKETFFPVLILAYAITYAVLFSGCSVRGGYAEASSTTVTVPSHATAPSIVNDAKGNSVILGPGSSYTQNAAKGKQPDNPDGPLTVEVSSNGAGANTAGANVPATNAMMGIVAGMWWLQLVGVVVALLGIVIFMAKRSSVLLALAPGPTPLISRLIANAPKGTGLGFIALGGALIVLPLVWSEVAWMVSPVIAIALVVIGIMWWRKYSQDKDDN